MDVLRWGARPAIADAQWSRIRLDRGGVDFWIYPLCAILFLSFFFVDIADDLKRHSRSHIRPHFFGTPIEGDDVVPGGLMVFIPLGKLGLGDQPAFPRCPESGSLAVDFAV